MKKVNLGNNIRRNFPIFKKDFEKRLCFLDSAASTQKPKVVIKRAGDFYKNEYSNIQRGAYALSARATDAYEETRRTVREFLGAQKESEIIFTRGTTESINLVSYSLENYFNEGDTILISIAEHHSNLVPWQQLAKRKKLNLQYVYINEYYNIDIKDFEEKVKSCAPRLVAITMLSNVLGSEFPVEDIIKISKGNGALVLLDGAQFVPHNKINIQKLGADFLAFSGHKMYGPTGVGVLYAKEDVQDKMTPFQFGGEMIEYVKEQSTTFAPSPHRFEAGTPSICEVVAFKEAINFINEIGIDNIRAHEKEIFLYAAQKLKEIDGVKVYLPEDLSNSSSVISFNIDNVHPHDFSSIADSFGVQIRSGFHCAMPLLDYLKINVTNRISFGVYSDKEDIDTLILAIKKAKDIFK